MTRYLSHLVFAIVLPAMFALGCAGEGDMAGDESGAPVADAGTPGARDTGDHDEDLPPEREEEFSFSTPTVVGDDIYIANETLDSLSIIDSRTLGIETLPVGFRPTAVAGPDPTHADTDQARVMVLNRGSSSLTVVDPDDRSRQTLPVDERANALAIDPSGEFGVVWYDDSRRRPDETAGDLSSVTVAGDGRTHRVAVGFHVRDVFFDPAAERALVWTDDGISPIELAELDGDTTSRPIPLLPDDLAGAEPDDFEVRVTPDARYVVARSDEMHGLVMLDVESRSHAVVPLPEAPTDLDLIGGQPPTLLAMLRESARAVRIEIPDGMRAASEALASKRDRVLDATSGAEAMAGSTGGDTDTGEADTGTGDDGGTRDTSASDTTVDATTDAADPTHDAGSTTDASSDTSDAGVDEPFFPAEIAGLELIDLQIGRLGAATVGATDETALLFTTVGDERRVVLLDLATHQQRVVALDKQIRGALSDRRGETFIVYNAKQPGEIPPDATPSDPAYVERKHGMTLIDVETASTRLVLTDHRPGSSAIAAAEEHAPKLFVLFERPGDETPPDDPAFRDVVEIDLGSFRTRTHRLPSLPSGLGPVAPAGKIFVAQEHPQGRMTFVDAATGTRQTVTGFQLNSQID